MKTVKILGLFPIPILLYGLKRKKNPNKLGVERHKLNKNIAHLFHLHVFRMIEILNGIWSLKKWIR